MHGVPGWNWTPWLAAPAPVHLPRTCVLLQRSGVLIDACQLGRGHSTFLQQASHLTGGIYLKPGKPQALIQYLNVSCGGGTRLLLRL
jgi:hypothetical protein